MRRFGIYVGLNDPITHQQLFGTEKYITTLKNVCKSYHVGFSFSVIQGGYIYDDGKLADETTLYITLLDVEEETVNEIAVDLCTFFNQESVMITEDEVKMRFIRGNREVQNAIDSAHLNK